MRFSFERFPAVVWFFPVVRLPNSLPPMLLLARARGCSFQYNRGAMRGVFLFSHIALRSVT